MVGSESTFMQRPFTGRNVASLLHSSCHRHHRGRRIVVVIIIIIIISILGSMLHAVSTVFRLSNRRRAIVRRRLRPGRAACKVPAGRTTARWGRRPARNCLCLPAMTSSIESCAESRSQQRQHCHQANTHSSDDQEPHTSVTRLICWPTPLTNRLISITRCPPFSSPITDDCLCVRQSVPCWRRPIKRTRKLLHTHLYSPKKNGSM